MAKRVSVIKEGSKGRNELFRDNYNKNIMKASDFVKEIKKGNYENYHIRVIKGKETPVSNPDPSTNNNLG
ncbi:MAG: hypothetical protein PHX04_00515 [Bacilli bacterium]|nr:hypothetical protein [Bacilli bacterium]